MMHDTLCKTADSIVVVNSALFFRNKFVTTGLKQLKSVLTDFYDVDVIAGTKCQLLDDTDKLISTSLMVKHRHLTRRHDGENRLSREVDDILSVFTILDEHELLYNLPRYVADSPASYTSV